MSPRAVLAAGAALGLLFLVATLWLRTGSPAEVLRAPAPTAPSPTPAPIEKPSTDRSAEVTSPEPQAAPPPTPGKPVPSPARSALRSLGFRSPTEGRPLSEEDVRAAVAALEPLVRHCWQDVAQRYPGGLELAYRFTLRVPAGGGGSLQRGSVEQLSVEDPYVRACLEDSLQEVPLSLPREGTAEVDVSFGFPVR